MSTPNPNRAACAGVMYHFQELHSGVSRKATKFSPDLTIPVLWVGFAGSLAEQEFQLCGGRQSLHPCFLQLGFSTSLSGKCYWIIKANCWHTPDSLGGPGEEPGRGEGGLWWLSRSAYQAGGCTFNHFYN